MSVGKGIEYENAVLDFLKKANLVAVRTNTTNVYDPTGYKHGFDGGIDIIAKFCHTGRTYKEYVFYIQCKNHKEMLTKSAVSEAYAGMHLRTKEFDNSIPVVFSTSDASQETRQFAKELGVELFLPEHYRIVMDAKNTKKATYMNHGLLLKAMLFYYTKDQIWLDSIPDNKNNLADIKLTEKYIEMAKSNFDQAQTYLDSASSFERKAEEARQKALDIQKAAVFRALHTVNNYKENKNKPASKGQSRLVEATDGSG